ncbi:MAG: hypothetical protein B6229_00480 [Spirochaetaceae bacterium 4572_7]|nr:MAG: hypothetical protein B6229_00480 [Spirochaetaceae bacterium 4572_7]
MKNLIIILMVMTIFVGCSMEPDLEDWEYVMPPDDGINSFLWEEDYSILINKLSTMDNIDRSTIDNIIINDLSTDKGEYSLYIGNYTCHSFHWDYYSSYSNDWLYYVTVDIWVNNGQLVESMCSYYR